MAYIYTLSDASGVRYIGKTNNINVRFKDHINTSKRINRPNNHRSNWILSLINKGELPIIDVIDIVPDDEWVFWEIYWISQFKTWGFNLVNSTLGGENPPSFAGKTHSKEYKKIRRDLMIKNNPAKNMNNNWKLKISESNKGREFSEEHIRKLSKPVIQLTLKNEFIKNWDSASAAGKYLNISIGNICSCCRGERKKCGRFRWEWKK